MNKFFYFKIAFIAVSFGLFAGLMVSGLFDVSFSDPAALEKLALKSAVRALVTGFVLGIFNIFLKAFPFQKK